MQPYDIGYGSEIRVMIFLWIRGCAILHHRYRAHSGEIDIIARQGCNLLFVEVRCRRGHDHYGNALDSVSDMKRRRIVRTAEHYLATHDTRYDEIRFDLCTLTHPWRGSIQWLQGVFHADGVL